MLDGETGNSQVVGRGGAQDSPLGTTNAQRAAWAEAALAAYTPLVTGRRVDTLNSEDLATCLSDLLADLIHYSRRERIDFDRALDAAFANAASEAQFLWDQPTE